MFCDLSSVASALDSLHDLRNVLLAGVVVGGLHHHADHRLGAGLPDKDAAGIAQCLGHRLDSGLHGGIVLRGLLIGHTDIFQHLRVDLQRGGQRTQRLLLGQHDLHHLQAGQDAVTGAGVLGEDDVAALLTADAAAVLGHILVDILVTHGSLGVADALLVKGLVQAKVGHNRGNDGVGQQFAALLHVAAVDVQDVVTGDHIALFIHAEAAVCIAVIGKAHVQTLFHHKLLQTLDVGGACVQVDVQAVGLVVDDIGVCAQCIEHTLGNVPAGTVGTVQTHLDALEGVDAQADQVAHVAVAARHIVHGAADMLPVGKGQLRPVLIKDMELAVNVVLHQQQGLLGHLFAVAIDQLDAVVVERVMAGGDHNAAVKIIHTGNVGHAGGGGDVEQVGICAGSSQARHQAVLEHIGTTAGVLTDDDAGRIRIAIALTELVVIPAEETAYLIGMISSQSDSGFTTEAIGSKILSHYSFFSSKE